MLCKLECFSVLLFKFVIYLFERVEVLTAIQLIVDLLYPHTHTLTEDSHNTGNFIPYSSRIVCGFFNVPQGTNEHGAYPSLSLSENTWKS